MFAAIESLIRYRAQLICVLIQGQTNLLQDVWYWNVNNLFNDVTAWMNIAL